MQGGRHCERRRWHCGYRSVAAIGASLDHRLGQFLDKERHPVSPLDDLVDNIRRQCPEIAGEPMHQRRPLVAAKPVQCQHRHLRPSDPGRLELRPVGCDQQHRQARDLRDLRSSSSREVGSIQCRILKDHQYRLSPRQRFELSQQCG